MGGGLMQLVAYGAQDIYLTGNPQMTFFKTVYRRHTNFSMECIRQTFKGTPGAGNRVVATLARNGDLVHDCFMKVTGATGDDSQTNPGYNIINNIELEIGGQLIDKHYGHWMEAHAELTEESIKGEVHRQMGQVMRGFQDRDANCPAFYLTAGAGGVTLKASGGDALENAFLFVPLRFWFCRHVGLSLPLIALQYHEVNINITFSAAYRSTTLSDVSLWCNYIYLDTDERRRFAQVSHEYLIEQVQFQSFTQVAGSNTFKLNFNHPVKELIWGCLTSEWGSTASAGEFTDMQAAGSATPTFQIKLNGHDRFEKQEAEYFTRYQAMKYHNTMGKASLTDSLAVYSFALKPEEHQPSGTCNFSRIDNAQLICTNLRGSRTLNIYAVNYNVLRIMSGMGGLAYSN